MQGIFQYLIEQVVKEANGEENKKTVTQLADAMNWKTSKEYLTNLLRKLTQESEPRKCFSSSSILKGEYHLYRKKKFAADESGVNRQLWHYWADEVESIMVSGKKRWKKRDQSDMDEPVEVSSLLLGHAPLYYVVRKRFATPNITDDGMVCELFTGDTVGDAIKQLEPGEEVFMLEFKKTFTVQRGENILQEAKDESAKRLED